MKNLILCSIILFFCTCLSAQAVVQLGVYKVEGVDLSTGESYTGKAVISLEGENYKITVTYTDGETEVATGVFKADKSVLVVTYKSDKNLGTARYHVKDKVMKGVWLSESNISFGTEELTWVSEK